MSVDDAAGVAGLSGQLGYPADPVDIGERIRALSSDPASALMVAEAADHRLLGWVHVVGRQFLESPPSAEVIGLVVDAGNRRTGVGHALLVAAESWAIAQGYPRMRIRSNTAREEARPFYLKNGYGVSKTQYVFQKELR